MFPGGDFNLGVLIFAVLGSFMFIAYAIIYACFPRTGTDYVFQSRVLHPAVGFASTITAWVIYQFWFAALNSSSFPEQFLIPFLVNLGHLTGNAGFVSLGNMFWEPQWLALMTYVVVIITGLFIIVGFRVYLLFQKFMFGAAVIAVAILVFVLATTSHEAFVALFNSFMSSYLGTNDAYSLVLSTARQAGVNLSPSFSWYETIGAAMLPWTFAMTWAVYGNLAMGGETKRAGMVKTHLLTILGPFYVVTILMVVIWNLFINMVGADFWNALVSLAWNGNAVFGKLPSLFAVVPTAFIYTIAINNPILCAVFAIAASLGLVVTGVTILLVPSRMLFAMTFDRLFPAGLASVSSKTNTPTYIAIITTILACIWSYAILSYSAMYHFLASVQFQISVTMILTMIGAIVFRWKLKETYAASAASKYGKLLIPSAIVGIIVNVIVIYLYGTIASLGALVPDSINLVIGVFVAGLVYYFAVSAYRRHQGLDLRTVFSQIPPE
jgi:amino acid transporter